LGRLFFLQTAQWKVGTTSIYFLGKCFSVPQLGQRACRGIEDKADESIGHAPLSSKPMVFIEVRFPQLFYFI